MTPDNRGISFHKKRKLEGDPRNIQTDRLEEFYDTAQINKTSPKANPNRRSVRNNSIDVDLESIDTSNFLTTMPNTTTTTTIPNIREQPKPNRLGKICKGPVKRDYLWKLDKRPNFNNNLFQPKKVNNWQNGNIEGFPGRDGTGVGVHSCDQTRDRDLMGHCGKQEW
jgi:hypothetical protein